LELFFICQWNNFLHSTVEAMIQGVLEGENEALKLALLNDAKLVDRICEGSKLNEEESAKPKGVRRGYMGHVTAISVNILNASGSNPSMEKFLAGHGEWNKYVKGALATNRERENKIIGGYMPADFNAEEDDLDEDYDNSEVIFEATKSDNTEEFNTNDNFGVDDDDDDEDDEEDEEGVVIQGVQRFEDDEEEEEGEDDFTQVQIASATVEHAEVWEEKTIEDNTDHASKTTTTEQPSDKTEGNTSPKKDTSSSSASSNTEEKSNEVTNHVGDNKVLEVSV